MYDGISIRLTDGKLVLEVSEADEHLYEVVDALIKTIICENSESGNVSVDKSPALEEPPKNKKSDAVTELPAEKAEEEPMNDSMPVYTDSGVQAKETEAFILPFGAYKKKSVEDVLKVGTKGVNYLVWLLTQSNMNNKKDCWRSVFQTLPKFKEVWRAEFALNPKPMLIELSKLLDNVPGKPPVTKPIVTGLGYESIEELIAKESTVDMSFALEVLLNSI